MSMTSPGISIMGWDENSCSISSMGKMAARSCGPNGAWVCGLSGGARGTGSDGSTFTQAVGIWLSASRNLEDSDMEGLLYVITPWNNWPPDRVSSREEISMNARCLPLLGGAVLLSSCVIATNTTGPTQYDSPSFERDDAKEVRLNLNMGAGDLKVGSGPRKLMQAYFTYNMPAWKPEIHYSAAGGVGNLTIDQPGGKQGHFGNTKYEWDVRLNQDIPLDVKVNFGAGQAQLDLGSLSLRSVEVDMGGGSLQMDLRGNPKHDYSVRINGGVGEAVIRLPANVGVYAEAGGGIGEVSARNLRKEDGHWVNEAYGDSKVKIHLTVEGGVGSIKLLGD